MTVDTGVLDTQGMLDAALALPEQMAVARDEARGLDGLPDREDIQQVVVLGMGGSGIAGDVLMAAAGPYMPVPVLVFRSYHVPAFVDESTLVFAVSFSGDTEETIEATTPIDSVTPKPLTGPEAKKNSSPAASSVVTLESRIADHALR